MALSLVLFLAAVLPSALAGPACAQKHHDAADCMSRCNTKWGFPGLMMASDPWGPVMHLAGKAGEDWDMYVAKACGVTTTSTPSMPAPTTASSTVMAVASLIRGGLATQSSSSVKSTSTTTTSSRASSTFTTSTIRRTTSSSTSTTPKTTSTTKKTTSTTQTPTTTRTTAKPAQTTAESLSDIGEGDSGDNNKGKGSSNDLDDGKSKSGNTNSNPGSNSGSGKSGSGNSGNSNSNNGGGNTNNGGGNTNNGGGNTNSGGGNGSRASNSDVQAYLAAHNSIRSQHGAAPLKWNNAVAVKAQEWSDKCLNKHSGGTLGRLGENLAAGTGKFSIAQAVKAWTDEVSDYNPNNPTPSHFTQVVWKASTDLGCAVTTCDGIFAGFGAAQYYVCEYSEAGNVIGSFGANVQK